MPAKKKMIRVIAMMPPFQKPSLLAFVVQLGRTSSLLPAAAAAGDLLPQLLLLLLLFLLQMLLLVNQRSCSTITPTRNTCIPTIAGSLSHS